jgi:site-specific recombinase XerD
LPASRKPVDEALAMAGIFRPGSLARPKPIAVEPQNHSGVTTDERLIDLWLARYDSAHTRRAYALDAEQFLAFVGALPNGATGLRTLTVAHVVSYMKHLRDESSSATGARRLSSLKSLLSFGHDTGYLTFNVGAAIKIPKLLDHLSDRILTVEQVRNLVAAARPGRDRAFIKFLYFSGARVSEAVRLQWKHIRQADGVLRVTLHGKGNKTRHVPLPTLMLADFELLGESRLGSYVFESCYGNALDTKDAWRIVRAAAQNAYIRAAVSPHWLRHAHATHALSRGAPAHVVQSTLGHTSLTTTGRYAHINNTESSGLFLSL